MWCATVHGQAFPYLLISSLIQERFIWSMLSIKAVSEMFVAAKRFQVESQLIIFFKLIVSCFYVFILTVFANIAVCMPISG